MEWNGWEVTEEHALITVVVTAYNAEQYLPRCLKSLLDQKECAFELLVIDDASRDNSLAVCQSMMRDVPFARVESIPHGGVSNARNHGLKGVRTKYVLFVDGDDALEPRTLSLLHQVAEERDPDLVVFGFSYEPASGRSHQVAAPQEEHLLQRSEILARYTELWDSGLLYSVWNKLFSVDVIRRNQLQFKDRDFGEDFEFCRNYLERCQRMSVLTSCCYRYTCHTRGSLSTSYRDDLFDIRVREHQEMERYFRALGCLDAEAEEFLARRHIERVVGCVENECSPCNHKSTREKLDNIKRIVTENSTVSTAKRARLSGLKMKILVLPIRQQWVCVTYLFGCIMTTCRNQFPRLFTWLKMNR
jgi:glycosyltransferase EpsJ